MGDVQKNISWIEQKLKKIQKRLRRVKDDIGKSETSKNDSSKDTKDKDGWTTLPTTVDSSVWNVKNSNPRLLPGKDILTVIFPKRGYKSRAGVNHKCRLDGFPAQEAELVYDVYVEKNWDPVKGGKLPGFFIGKNGTGGKQYEKNDGSVRIMWRRGGQLVGYVYLCTDQGKDVSKKQGKSFLKACDDHFPPAGIDLWRRTKEKVHLKNGQWNTVRMGVRMNDPGVSNGKIWLEVNGERLEVDDAYFTEDPKKNAIGGLQWSLWYGGGSADWSPSKEQQLVFRNIKYRST
jgi:hypothetical protein